MKRLLRGVALLSVLLAVTVGCRTMTGQSLGTNVDNKMTTASVKTKLAAQEMRHLTWVDVDTNDGVVYLSGTATSQAGREQAERVAASVDGVKRVVNNIQVQPAMAGAAGAPPEPSAMPAAAAPAPAAAAAPPAGAADASREVTVQVPPAQITVQPPPARVVVQQQAPQITVQPSEPQVIVQPPSQPAQVMSQPAPPSQVTAPPSTTAPSAQAVPQAVPRTPEPAASPALGASAVSGMMTGTVEDIDVSQGLLTVQTAEREVQLRVPPDSLRTFKKGDRVSIETLVRPMR
jgi:hypothetical protein